MAVHLIIADYSNPQHASTLRQLLNNYARDPMGGGKAIDESVLDGLADKLRGIAGAFSVLCYVDEVPAGFANCFQGFSTFAGKPLINIHDFAIEQRFRGLGLSQQMMQHIETHARRIGACKITLEVLERNQAAQQAYKKSGFSGYELNPKTGKALFWEKSLIS